MHGVAAGSSRTCIRSKRAESVACRLERVAAHPEQLRLEALLAQLVELVEVKLEYPLVAAQLAPERTFMVESASEPRCEPESPLIRCLVEFHREIDVADLERTPGVRAEDPHLPHPRQIPPLACRDTGKQTLDPSHRFSSPHKGERKCRPQACVSVGLVNVTRRRGRVASRRFVLCRSQVRRDQPRGRRLRSVSAGRRSVSRVRRGRSRRGRA